MYTNQTRQLEHLHDFFGRRPISDRILHVQLQSWSVHVCSARIESTVYQFLLLGREMVLALAEWLS